MAKEKLLRIKNESVQNAEELSDILAVDTDVLFQDMLNILEWIVYHESRGSKIVAMSAEDYDSARLSGRTQLLKRLIPRGNESKAKQFNKSHRHPLPDRSYRDEW